MKPLTPTGPTHDQLRSAEATTLDALNAIGMAIAHKIVLGVNIACISNADGSVVTPGIAIFLPGEKSKIPGTDDGPVRQLRLTIPRDGINFLGLLASAGDFCHGALCNAQETGDVDCTDYFTSRQEIEQCRKKGKSRILLPGSAGRN